MSIVPVPLKNPDECAADLLDRPTLRFQEYHVVPSLDWRGVKASCDRKVFHPGWRIDAMLHDQAQALLDQTARMYIVS